MDLSFFSAEESLPVYIAGKLAAVELDYSERYLLIKNSAKAASPQLGAGVVLLLHHKENNAGNSEYVFQLIKRSEQVSQSGDISCPGGMLHPAQDKVLSFLISHRLICKMPKRPSYFLQNKSKDTMHLIRLFLANALREAWEEIGLNPFNVVFLGALPTYSLSLFTRTIFPLVCLISRPYKFKISSEVEKVMEVPVGAFFNGANYAHLEIEMPFDNTTTNKTYYPCLLVRGRDGKKEILWGATLHIIVNFLQIVSGGKLSIPAALPKVKKVLTTSYVSGSRQ